MRFADDTVLGVAEHRRISLRLIVIRNLEIGSENPGQLMNFSGIARNTRLQQEPGVTAGRKWNTTKQHHGAA